MTARLLEVKVHRVSLLYDAHEGRHNIIPVNARQHFGPLRVLRGSRHHPHTNAPSCGGQSHRLEVSPAARSDVLVILNRPMRRQRKLKRLAFTSEFNMSCHIYVHSRHTALLHSRGRLASLKGCRHTCRDLPVHVLPARVWGSGPLKVRRIDCELLLLSSSAAFVRSQSPPSSSPTTIPT